MESMARSGPIPARAGQPRPSACWATAHRAYPRSRGATLAGIVQRAQYQGLSPLARGNPMRESKGVRRQGPIPARAGQPESGRRGDSAHGAYPRSRGATLGGALMRLHSEGLSPLARGNRVLLRRLAWSAGPIPARAGQPV